METRLTGPLVETRQVLLSQSPWFGMYNEVWLVASSEEMQLRIYVREQ